MVLALVLLVIAGLCLFIARVLQPVSSPPDAEEVRPRKPTVADRQARAQSVGIVHRSEYLDPETEQAALVLDENGLPTAALEPVRDQLLLVTEAGWVNPRSRSLGRVGLHSFRIRGTSYYQAEATAADLRPGRWIDLVREPDNEFDPNAIALCATAGRKVGYVNKQNASRMTKRLDAGEDLLAITTRGSRPGSDDTTPQVLVASREVMNHLTRHLK